MKITCVKGAFFSATGNTKFAVTTIAGKIAEKLGVPLEIIDFTEPGKRKEELTFREGEAVVFGMPVYAGRVPNKILPFLQTHVTGGGALAVPVVTFGNRSYDNALIELRNELENGGFHTVAAAAFVSRHAFSEKLAGGRPDEKDKQDMNGFADAVAEKFAQLREIPKRVFVAGTEPVPAYYTPLGTDGKPAVFLKAKPKTLESCSDCGICAALCPMGSIDFAHPREVNGICIKCQACVRGCPQHAKYFDDPAFLSHVEMLERSYSRRAENELFF